MNLDQLPIETPNGRLTEALTRPSESSFDNTSSHWSVTSKSTSKSEPNHVVQVYRYFELNKN